MNLVTYAAPVSIKPRRYALGLYLGTLSHANFKQTGRGLLQVLRARHAPLFNLLGKTSGRDVDKLAAIKESGFSVQAHASGLHVLSDAACAMELQAMSDFIPCGDHEVVICDVVGYENGVDCTPEDALYTAYLRQEGYMQK
ncbi:hypothetical protein FOA52_006699 [Chlamydomonas sp. UWO 241]|nr:hypothetical protein FOA52_006699 [Chlamydomonas sp. UWO 241]